MIASHIGSLLGFSAGAALMGVGIALAVALLMAVAAASLSTRASPRATPPPADPEACLTTLTGEVADVRAGLPPGDYRAWSEHGPPKRSGTEPLFG
jgi:hypothetical protein